MDDQQWGRFLVAWGLLLVTSWLAVIGTVLLVWTFPVIGIAGAIFAIFMGAAWAAGR